MSQFKIEIVRIGALEKHPNADTLSITKVYEYPVIVRTGDFKEGDAAVYVPVDALVPTDRPEFSFLASEAKEHEGKMLARIKAKKLRGIFSMGLLIPAPADFAALADQIKERAASGEQTGKLNASLQEALGIMKWQPPIPMHWGGQNERDPGNIPIYTDIDHYRRYPNVLIPGERVIATEKIHGTNSRFVYADDRLWVGSHECIKKEQPDSTWWKIAEKYRLKELLSLHPRKVFYGETYGWIQDLKYGAITNGDIWLRIFDVYDWATGHYMHYDEMANLVQSLGLELAPVLYDGPWDPVVVLPHADGVSTLDRFKKQIREGIVIRPARERFDQMVGRVILKHVSEAYLTRKDGTEYH